jgi:hypothetical protein
VYFTAVVTFFAFFAFFAYGDALSVFAFALLFVVVFALV